MPLSNFPKSFSFCLSRRAARELGTHPAFETRPWDQPENASWSYTHRQPGPGGFINLPYAASQQVFTRGAITLTKM